MRTLLLPRLLASAWLALFVYALLSVTLGPGGVAAAGELERGISAMKANLVALEEKNRALSADLEALRSDRDRGAREARALGYLAERESEVVIVGRPRAEPLRPEAGQALPAKSPASVDDGSMKALAGLAGLLSFAASLVFRPLPQAQRSRRRRGGAAAAVAGTILSSIL